MIERIARRVRRAMPWGWRPYRAVEDVPCNVCGSRSVDVVAGRVSFGMRYTNVLCRDCGLVWLSPRPSAASFASFYVDLYPRLYGRETRAVAGTDRGRDVAAFLEQHADLARAKGVFDVGAGDGGLLLALAERQPRLRLAGCEPAWDGPAVIRHAGATVDVQRIGIDDVDSLEGFDIIALYDVVEHLLDPASALRSLRERADENATLFASTSCLDHWEEIPPFGLEDYYLRLAHTYTFTRKTFRALLAKAGWRVEVQELGPRGDQWVLARPGTDSVALADPTHAAQVRDFIENYRGLAAA